MSIEIPIWGNVIYFRPPNYPFERGEKICATFSENMTKEEIILASFLGGGVFLIIIILNVLRTYELI